MWFVKNACITQIVCYLASPKLQQINNEWKSLLVDKLWWLAEQLSSPSENEHYVFNANY